MVLPWLALTQGGRGHNIEGRHVCQCYLEYIFGEGVSCKCHLLFKCFQSCFHTLKLYKTVFKEFVSNRWDNFVCVLNGALIISNLPVQTLSNITYMSNVEGNIGGRRGLGQTGDRGDPPGCSYDVCSTHCSDRPAGCQFYWSVIKL